MVDLTVLGAVRISLSSGDVALAAQQPKRTALLAYLATAKPRGSHRRDALIAMFWPELDQDRARSALRQALHAIRRSLGPDAVSSEGTEVVSLVAGAFRCDLWGLEDAAARGDHAKVLALYAGELMHGLHVLDAPDFERWLDGERARVRATVRGSAWAEAERALEDGRADDVVRCAKLAVSLSELDEAAARRAMSLMASVGQRAGALALYEDFVAELRRELELEPSAETVATAAELRESHVVPRPLSAVRAIRHRGPRPLSAVRALSTRPRDRWIAAATLVVATFGATTLLASARSRAFDPRQIRVESFGADSVAVRVAQSVREELASLNDARVAASAAGPDRAGTIVRGAVRVVGDSLEIRAEVVDRSTDVILRTVTTRQSQVPGPRSQVPQFTDQLKAAVATALYPGWGTALSQPLSYESYRLLLDGMQWIKREEHDMAVAAFTRAFANDSSFTTAGLLAASEWYQLGKLGIADSITRRLAPRRATMRDVDARLLDWLTRSLDGDRIGARAAMEAITVLAPSAELAWLQLAIDNVETARPREALAALSHIDPKSDFGEGWTSYWATQLEALHIMRDHERELNVAREALRRHPNLGVLVSYELRALAALGRISEVDSALSRVAATPRSRGQDAPAMMRQVALELAAHGNHGASRHVLERARAWYTARSADERATRAWTAGYAQLLYLTDDRAAARKLYDSLRTAFPECLDCVGAIGVLDARSSDTAAVTRAMATLSAANRKFLFGRNVMWRARIAAAFGDLGEAEALLAAAFSAGFELDVMTHADFELARIHPDAVYRRVVRLEP